MRLTAKTQLLTFILIMTLFSVSCGKTAGKEQGLEARDGLFDLGGSPGDTAKSVDLDGEWEIYRGLLLEPGEFGTAAAREGRELVAVPDQWNPGWKVYRPSLARGVATYRLRVIVGEGRFPDPALWVQRVQNAYRLYVNGVFVHGCGLLENDPQAVIPLETSEIVPLIPDTDEYEIVIQAANFQSPVGGITQSIQIGSLSGFYAKKQLFSLFSVFLATSLFLLFLYQLFMYVQQPYELEYLLFSAFCLCAAVYSVFIDDYFWPSILPPVGWSIYYYVLYLMLYLDALFFILYIGRIFPLDTPRRPVRILVAADLLFPLVMAVSPSGRYAFFLPFIHLDIAVTIVLAFLIILRSVRNRRPGYRHIYAGFGLLAASGVYDLLAVGDLVPSGIVMLQWGFLAMSLMQVLGLSRNFVLLRRRSHILAADNEKMKALLSEREDEGHREISAAVRDKMRSAVDYLRENYTGDISRENLAAALDMHPDNFSRYFRQHTGKKYSEYLNELRVAEAARLLRETDDPVITIAMNSGFNSLRNFNHAFLSITGKSPGNVRKG